MTIEGFPKQGFFQQTTQCMHCKISLKEQKLLCVNVDCGPQMANDLMDSNFILNAQPAKIENAVILGTIIGDVHALCLERNAIFVSKKVNPKRNSKLHITWRYCTLSFTAS
jgi:hypothetical protein